MLLFKLNGQIKSVESTNLRKIADLKAKGFKEVTAVDDKEVKGKAMKLIPKDTDPKNVKELEKQLKAAEKATAEAEEKLGKANEKIAELEATIEALKAADK